MVIIEYGPLEPRLSYQRAPDSCLTLRPGFNLAETKTQSRHLLFNGCVVGDCCACFFRLSFHPRRSQLACGPAHPQHMLAPVWWIMYPRKLPVWPSVWQPIKVLRYRCRRRRVRFIWHFVQVHFWYMCRCVCVWAHVCVLDVLFNITLKSSCTNAHVTDLWQGWVHSPLPDSPPESHKIPLKSAFATLKRLHLGLRYRCAAAATIV